jgi:uncharacterized membrane protein YhiD involved in acid resistance
MEDIAREGEGVLPYFSFIFFSTFVIITTWILLNVVFGLIIDSINNSKPNYEMEEEKEEEKNDNIQKMTKFEKSEVNIKEEFERLKNDMRIFAEKMDSRIQKIEKLIIEL